MLLHCSALLPLAWTTAGLTRSRFQRSSTQICSPQSANQRSDTEMMKSEQGFLLHSCFLLSFFLCDIDRPDRQLSFRRCMLCTPFKAPYSQISQVWTLKNGGAQNKQPLWKSWPISQWGVNLVTYTQQPSTTQKLSIRTIKPQQAIWKQKLSMMQQLRSYSSPLSI